MGDPFSIAASATGFISLGLTVCKGLIEYYAAWKDYDGDLATTTASIESFSKTLQHFDERLSNFGPLDEKLALTLRSNITLCETGIAKLDGKLRKIRSTGAPGLLNKLERQRRRLLYPFKSSTLAKLQEIIADLRQNLLAAAGVLQLDTSLVTIEKLDEVSAGITILGWTFLHVHLTDRINDWLDAPDPSSNYNQAVSKREPSTGEWLLVHDDFRHWQIQPNGLIWLHGGAGCGKTVLSSTIITAAQIISASPKSSDSAVIYYFFDFKDPEKQIAENLVRSLLKQLSIRSSEAQAPLEKLYDRFETGSKRPPLQRLLDTLREMIRACALKDLYIVVDALDECGDLETLMDVVEQIHDWNFPQVHLLATSRNNRNIKFRFDEVVLTSIEIESAAVDGDIRTFVVRHMQRDAWWSRWSEDIRTKVIRNIMQKARGMFRWAVCQLQELRKSLYEKMLEDRLDRLPRTLDDTYARMLEEIDEDFVPFATKLLPWLCLSNRPIALDEMNDVLATHIHDGQRGFDARYRFLDPFDVQLICPNILTINSQDIQDQGMPRYRGKRFTPVLALAHYSVKEYLSSGRLKGGLEAFQVDEAEGQALITELCIEYLLQFNDHGWTHDRWQEFPLAHYAASNWFKHYIKAESLGESGGLYDLALQLLQPGSPAYTSLLKIHSTDETLVHSSERDMELVSPLYYAANVGARSLTEGILQITTNRQNESEGLHGTPLKAAICNHDMDIVKVLAKSVSMEIERNIERPYKVSRIGPYTIIEPAAQYGHSAIVVAAEEQHEGMIDILLDHIPFGSESLGDCEAALRLLEGSHDSISQATYAKILSHMKTSWTQTQSDEPNFAADPVRLQLNKFLSVAAEKDNLNFLQALLASGADPNVKKLGFSVLYNTAAATSATTITTNTPSTTFSSSLSSAFVFGGSPRIILALLDAGAVIDAIEPSDPLSLARHVRGLPLERETALHAAAKARNHELIRLLLSRGANFDKPNRFRQTPASLWLWRPFTYDNGDGDGGNHAKRSSRASQDPSDADVDALIRDWADVLVWSVCDKALPNTRVAGRVVRHARFLIQRAMRRWKLRREQGGGWRGREDDRAPGDDEKVQEEKDKGDENVSLRRMVREIEVAWERRESKGK